jgi:hypothetical protein
VEKVAHNKISSFSAEKLFLFTGFSQINWLLRDRMKRSITFAPEQSH